MQSSDRSFKVLGVKKPGQDMTTTTSHAGRYISKTPYGAASKALTRHCNDKDIHGVCTFLIVMQETTAGSNKKVYAYKAARKRVDEKLVLDNKPVHFKYKNTLHSSELPKYFRPSAH